MIPRWTIFFSHPLAFAAVIFVFFCQSTHAANVDICLGDKEFCDKVDSEKPCPPGFAPELQGGISICIEVNKKKGQKTVKAKVDVKGKKTQVPGAERVEVDPKDKKAKGAGLITERSTDQDLPNNAGFSATEIDPRTLTAPAEDGKIDVTHGDGARAFPAQRYPPEKAPPKVVPNLVVAAAEQPYWKSFPEKGAQPTGKKDKGVQFQVIKYYPWDAKEESGHVYEVKDFSMPGDSFFITAAGEINVPFTETLGDFDTPDVKKYDVTSPKKRRPISVFSRAGACAKIKAAVKSNSRRYKPRKIVKHRFKVKGKSKVHPGITQYFTPIFKSLEAKHRGKKYRYWCKNIEGACIVGDILHAYGKKPIQLKTQKCKFGFGNGARNNATNCLDPCVSVAADQSKSYLKSGTVLYIPQMDGKICPQSGTKINGCFVVSDVGSWIKGPGNFDLFAGECFNYDGGVCKDFHMSSFKVRAGNTFYALPASDPLSQAYRNERDNIIRSEWR